MTPQTLEHANDLAERIGKHGACSKGIAENREKYAKDVRPIQFGADLVTAVELLTKDEVLTLLALIESLHDGHKHRLQLEFDNL